MFDTYHIAKSLPLVGILDWPLDVWKENIEEE